MSRSFGGFLQSLSWRRALKHFTPQHLSLGQINCVLEAARLAPSSFGIQPYYIHVISNKEVKERLFSASYNQAQITECSHLLVFTARNDAKEAVQNFIKASNVSEGYARMLDSVASMDSAEFLAYATNQAFLSLGFALAAAADAGLGSCPMTGFIPSQYHKCLGLPPNEVPVALLALGYAPEDDKVANHHPKFRFKLEDLVKFKWSNEEG